jgi:hypothetical protein
VGSPRFLADEDLRRDIVTATRRLEPGITFSTVLEQGLGQSSDVAVLEFAAANQWILVSHDVNTMKARAEEFVVTGKSMAGLFLVPQFRPTRPVAETLLLVWAASEAEEWANRIVYLPF